jgi:catalase
VTSTGATGHAAAPQHAEDNEFVQAGNLYRLMAEDEKGRLIDNRAGFIAQVSREDIIERAVNNFRQADADFGKRLDIAVQALRV